FGCAVFRSVRDYGGRAEAPVEPGFDHVSALADVDIASREPVKEEWNVARAEVVVVVLDKARQIDGDPVFHTGAYGPAAARLAGSRDGERGAGQITHVFVALPGAASLHVGQNAVQGITDAAGHRAH